MDIDSPPPLQPKPRIVKKVIRRKKEKKDDNHQATTKNNVNKDQREEDEENVPNPIVERKKQEYRKQVTDKVMFEKKTFEVQTLLIDNTISLIELERYSIFLQPNHYDDIVLERAISKICGYPTCKNRIIQQTKSFKYYISTKDQKVYDQQELSNYCSTDCLSKSKLYQFTLDKTPVYLRNIDLSLDITKPEITLSKDLEKNLKIVEKLNVDDVPINMNFGSINSDTPIKVGGGGDVEMMSSSPSISHKQRIVKSISDDEHLTDKSQTTDVGSQLDEDDEYQDFSEDAEDQEFSSDDQSIYSFMDAPQSSKLPVSNYHSVYAPLSDWITTETHKYLNSNNQDLNQPNQSLQIKQALHHYLSLYLPIIIKEMDMKEYLNVVNESLTDLIDTFTLTRPVPSLAPNHWKMVVLVFISSLIKRVSTISQYLTVNQSRLLQLCKNYGFDQYYLKVFVDLLMNGYQ